MRLIASFLLLGLALPASAAEVWRWKDANGWHFSDSPVAGAEKITINPAPKSGGSRPAPTYSSAPMVLPQEIVRYARCLIAQPANDAVFQWTESVSASVMVQPGLQTGHRIEVLLNGSPFPQWTPDMLSYSFTGLSRGSYTLAARVMDAKGGVLCAGPPITFHIRQPTLLSPARKPQAR
jgi:hypothetical protein